jgi:hypothetical protein
MKKTEKLLCGLNRLVEDLDNIEGLLEAVKKEEAVQFLLKTNGDALSESLLSLSLYIKQITKQCKNL